MVLTKSSENHLQSFQNVIDVLFHCKVSDTQMFSLFVFIQIIYDCHDCQNNNTHIGSPISVLRCYLEASTADIVNVCNNTKIGQTVLLEDFLSDI